MSNIIEKLTENIVARDLSKEGAALVNKWEKTGLLEGLGNERDKDNMSRLLENQAKELLREASTMAAGDVEGFAAVAFPIVRRVFGGLLANDLVSVQPMSLPSGLIFFMDFTKTQAGRDGDAANASVYGGGKVAAQITGGVSLTGLEAERSFYSLNNGYSSPISGTGPTETAVNVIVASGAIDADGVYQHFSSDGSSKPTGCTMSRARVREILRGDPALTSGTAVLITEIPTGELDSGAKGWGKNLNKDNLISITFNDNVGTFMSGTVRHCGVTQLRRLSSYLTSSDGSLDRTGANFVFKTTGSWNYAGATPGVERENKGGGKIEDAENVINGTSSKQSQMRGVRYATADGWESGGAVGSVMGSAASWLLESDVESVEAAFSDINTEIPEIDIKVDSVAVTAQTKKLRAKWSPELGQDLNAYHNLDAEVELTGILSEQVALEIDREIINDLIQRATGGTLHWARSPGLFVNRETGSEIGASSAAPDFTGTVSEWYETLLETVNDVSARIHRKTLRGGANFMVTSPEVASILEFTAGFRASVTVDSNGTAGANKVGSVSKKYDVYVDPYFPRNLVLVGRKGSSFLESGYVYAPYVPLQVTPTIFGTEDFAPRKGVMTRYAKKMVRPDMYGLVVVHGLVGLAGATS